jgi:hypothetical protein
MVVGLKRDPHTPGKGCHSSPSKGRGILAYGRKGDMITVYPGGDIKDYN